MKVDGLAVILAIILLPIILVVTYYIQLQVDTIAMENQYNTKLLAATHSAMSAFELNTANEDLSGVADSMRSIILASNNVFLDVLANNLGMSNASRELLQPYIPAVLYTMYDGYYIYAPTKTPVVAKKTKNVTGSSELIETNGYYTYGEMDDTGNQIIPNSDIDSTNAILGDILYEADSNKVSQKYTVNKDNAKTEQDYILKSYVQYSARYIHDSTINVTINYTLDNYLNIAGNIDGVYYTKTGYLIKKGLVTDATIEGNNNVLKTYNEYDAKNKILGLRTNSEVTTIPAADNASVKVNGEEISCNFGWLRDEIHGIEGGKYNDVDIKTIDDVETYLAKIYEDYNNGGPVSLGKINEIEYAIQKCKAVAYYVSSQIFSNWVYDNLGVLIYGDVRQNNSVESYEFASGVNADENMYYQFSGNTTPIFKADENPEDITSTFYTHKLEVIKNSIKYNLNLAISAYTNTMNSSYNFSLPVLEDTEWNKILNNISIVSFMQGWNCGLNIYNNYQIVSSTNNELTVSPSEIYYVKKEEFNNTSGIYHRIDCPELESGDLMSLKSKEVKYDKVYDRNSNSYTYDHKNVACYTCINTGNYSEKSLFDIRITDYYDRIKTLKNATGSGDDRNKQKEAYIGLAKERIDTYKTNALPVSQGYKVQEYPDSTVQVSFPGDLKSISKLYITMELERGTNREPIFNFGVDIKNSGGTVRQHFDDQVLRLEQTGAQTLELELNKEITDSGSFFINIVKDTSRYGSVVYKIKSIKAIYK